MANLLAQRIEEAITPVVGSVLAAVSVDLEARRIGKTADTLTRDDLDQIAENLSGQLRLVVGEELARAASARVRGLR
jgi:hypothetical protein